jgi:hypothetical protein
VGEKLRKQTRPIVSLSKIALSFTRACLVNQIGGEEAAEKPFLDERLATREANEKMVLEPLAYLLDTS